jgi:sugar phosphate isomerase/epimerase
MRGELTRRDFLRTSVLGIVVALLARTTAWGAAPSPVAERLAVCSWSLQPTSADDLMKKLSQTGLTRVQIALDPLRRDEGGRWSALAALAARDRVTLVSGMFGTKGEDYTTLETIRRTGGIVPDATWDENWRSIQANADLAERLGLKLVTFHAGFLPHDEKDPTFPKLLSRLRQIADLFARRGIALGLETGQETAETLAAFLRRLDRANVGVNFDPANMILYGKGEPVASLAQLGPWVRQVHVKDAVRTKVPGTWGEEVPVGKGEVVWKDFLAALDRAGFAGPLCIEREGGRQRVADIRAARQLVLGLSR